MIRAAPGIPGPIRSLAFLPPGRVLLAAERRRLRAWDYSQEQEATDWTTHRRPIAQVHTARDGRALLWRGEAAPRRTEYVDGGIPPYRPGDELVGGPFVADGTLHCERRGEISSHWEDSAPPMFRTLAASLSRDGRRAAVVDWWRFRGEGVPLAVTLRDAADGRTLARLHVEQWVSGPALATSADGGLVAVGIDGAHALIWEPDLSADAPDRYSLFGQVHPRGLWQGAARPQRPPLRYGRSSCSRSVAFSEDDSILATTSGSRLLLWDVAKGGRIATLTGHEAAVTAVGFPPSGPTVASVSCDGTLRFWDHRAGDRAERLQIACGLGRLFALAFSADGQLAAVGGELGCGLVALDERMLT